MADDLEKLVLSISADTSALARQLKRMESDTSRSTRSVEQSFDSMGKGIDARIRQVGNSIKTVPQSIGATKAATQSLQFQLNDIATQLASGTSPFQVMAQQGGQVVQALTGSGGVLGALRLIGGAVANPFTLATVAITTLAGVATAYFRDSSKDTEEANKKLEEHRAAIKAAIDAWQGAPPKELVAYNDELERLSNLDKQRAGLQAIIDNGLKPVNEAAAKAAETFNELFGRLEARNVDVKVLSDLRRDFDLMKKAIDGGNASVNDLLPLFTRLQDLEASIGTTKGFATLKEQIQSMLPLVDKANAKLESTRRIVDNLGSTFRVDRGDDVGSFLRDRSRPTIALPDAVNETPERRIDPFFADPESGSSDKLKRAAEKAADKLNDAIARQTAVAVDAASQFIGQNENTNGANINAFLKAGGVDLNAATTAWCAAFVNSALAQVGVKGTGSNVATDFLNFGKSVNLADIQRGDILVDPNGRGAGQTGGHVGFATGQVRATAEGITQLEILSGNASDSVKTDWINASEVVARRATDAFVLPANALQNLTQKSAEAKAATEAQTAALAAQKQAYENLNQVATTVLNGIATALADGKIEGKELLQILFQVAQQLLTMPRAPGGGGAVGGGNVLGSILGGIGSIFGFANGGVAQNGKPITTLGVGSPKPIAIFGETATAEAAVPLTGGRKIPVNMNIDSLSNPLPARRNGGSDLAGIDIKVGVSPDSAGNLTPYIESVSARTARQVTKAGIASYDKQLDRSIFGKVTNAQMRQG